MGCDIHLFAERRVNGSWVSADTWTDDKYEEGRTEVAYETVFYHDRNYNLFAMLANVRNGVGFAGIDTGDGFSPISEPKGLPPDCSEQVRAESDGWGSDGHSHSWLTVAELLAYDWTQTTTHRGYVNVQQWAKFVTQGRPDGWSGMVSGGRVTHHEPDAFEAAWTRFKTASGRAATHLPWHLTEDDCDKIASLVVGANGSPYARVSWSTPYFDSARGFLSETMPRLWRLGAADDVRIVFWFDN